MIHIAIGTKAQFIKMAPIMHVLAAKGLPYNLIDLGQHSEITDKLRLEFGLKNPDVRLGEGGDANTVLTGLNWGGGVIKKGFLKYQAKKNIFLNQKGICLIHGDTASTLLALYFAKIAGIKTAHIEAGLRSFNYLEPFPEEVIRMAVMKYSDMLFAPSKWSFENLKRMGLGEKAYLLPANTSLESARYSLNKKQPLGLDLEKFALVTVHRMENIFFKRRLEYVIDLIAKASCDLPVVFIRHAPTIARLKKSGLQERLNGIKNVHFLNITSHAHFIHLLDKSEFVVTDGGSIQEEAFYLNKPCFLLRQYTEREYGLGGNAVLSKFSYPARDAFLKTYQDFKRKTDIDFTLKPSEEILNRILNFV